MVKITIGEAPITLAQLRAVYNEPVHVTLSKESEALITKSEKCVEEILKSGKTVYGINTGFGLLAKVSIPPEDLSLLQKSLIRSHSVSVGEPIEDGLVRLVMLMKIKGLSRGCSGVRLSLVQQLVNMLNAEVYPVIPRKGSVGASGDLAPLSHMVMAMMGEGFARYKGKEMTGAEALKAVGLKPYDLGPKEGLALNNGTQVSTSFALKGLFLAEECFADLMATYSLSLEGYAGQRAALDPRIHKMRGHKTQIDAAAIARELLGKSSGISKANKGNRVQDPYSFRCMPQVMGACLNQIRNAADVLEIEANAAVDNPLVFVDNGDIISGGNFHAEPVAQVADNLAVAINEMGAIAERRIAELVDPNMSRLPAFLVEKNGVNSGFMIVAYTAAALASQNKGLSFPYCCDSIPTSANQEDFVSMAPNAARRLWEMADNVKNIAAIEFLTACQAIDLQKDPNTGEHHKPAPKLEEYHDKLRKHVTYWDKDRFFWPDIQAAIKMIDDGIFRDAVEAKYLPSWH
jgi:histidine ammonia-lyase